MKYILIATMATILNLSYAQDGPLTPPAQGQTVQSVLADIQQRVDKVQTLKANMEFDRKDEDAGKKKKKKKKEAADNKGDGVNPKWPEPEGRDVERGPLEISRGTGARVYLQRKKEEEVFVANSSSLWKHDIDDKEAKHIPTSWPVVDTFVSNALRMNVFVAMEQDTIKLRGSQNVNGMPCWALEGKSPSKLSMLGMEAVNLKIWIGKEDGIPRLIKVSGEDDTAIRLNDVQLNVPISADRFQYTLPAGVKTENIFGF